MDSMAPSAGAGTSTVTLSVSSSSKGSSRLTASPSFLNQRATVASVTDSPMAGTLISMVMACVPARIPPLILEGQCVVEEGGQFGQMLFHQARRGGGIFGPSDIARDGLAAQFGNGLGDAGDDKVPGALVFGLFLAPDQISLGKAVELLRQHIFREGIKLF